MQATDCKDQKNLKAVKERTVDRQKPTEIRKVFKMIGAIRPSVGA